mmetsp:Transcript_63482/g.112899  ORF Transcript_63482/g.112899 Transcript_63482/m.112899 type:complete len:627 (-) Transcript_63482:44-1924(-)
MLSRLSTIAVRHRRAPAISCFRARQNALHRQPPAAKRWASSVELESSLSAAIEKDPAAAAEEIRKVLDPETAKRLAEVFASNALDEPSRPSPDQLRMCALAAALPFFGFGVLDNAIMILLGEAIDATLCVKFGFSTMMAAAIGNTFSDAVGVFSGGGVEDLARKYGVSAPKLTQAQDEMNVTRTYTRVGQLVGIVIGCFVGMFPLLFVGHSDVTKREKALDEMFHGVIDTVAQLLDCEAAMLLLIDQDKKELYPRTSSEESLDHFRTPVGKGISGTVASTGQFLKIDDLPQTDYHRPERHDNYFGTGIKVKSVLCVPIFGTDPIDKEYKVLGVLQVINKRGTDKGFSDKDEDVCAALCSHISTSLATAFGLESGFRHTLENCERMLNMRGVRLNPAQDRRQTLLYEEVMRDCTEGLNATSTLLLVSDLTGQTTDLMVKASDKIPFFRHHVSRLPIMHKCHEDGITMCVNDVVNSTYYNPEVHDNYEGTGINIRAICAAPCLSTDGETLAVLASMKGEEDYTPYSAADVRFLNSVASNLALNLQGTGASLQRTLQLIKSQHKDQKAEAAALVTEDCSKEVMQIVGSVINLVQKAGGSVDQQKIRKETQQSFEDSTTGRKVLTTPGPT